MRNHKLTALLLTAALVLTMGAATALADSPAESTGETQSDLVISPAGESSPAADTAQPGTADVSALEGAIITDQAPSQDDN